MRHGGVSEGFDVGGKAVSSYRRLRISPFFFVFGSLAMERKRFAALAFALRPTAASDVDDVRLCMKLSDLTCYPPRRHSDDVGEVVAVDYVAGRPSPCCYHF